MRRRVPALSLSIVESMFCFWPFPCACICFLHLFLLIFSIEYHTLCLLFFTIVFFNIFIVTKAAFFHIVSSYSSSLLSLFSYLKVRLSILHLLLPDINIIHHHPNHYLHLFSNKTTFSSARVFISFLFIYIFFRHIGIQGVPGAATPNQASSSPFDPLLCHRVWF